MTAFGQYADDNCASTCKQRDYKDATDLVVTATGSVTHALTRSQKGATEDDTGRVGAGCWWDGGQLSQTLDAVLAKRQTMPERNRFPAVLQQIVAPPLTATNDPSRSPQSAEVTAQVSAILHATMGASALSIAENQRAEVRLSGTTRALACAGGKPEQGYPAVITGESAAVVRRLTPVECERLQGFPDHHTAISYRGRPATDGPRYKALGNSMAVPVVRWIGERIAAVDAALPPVSG